MSSSLTMRIFDEFTKERLRNALTKEWLHPGMEDSAALATMEKCDSAIEDLAVVTKHWTDFLSKGRVADLEARQAKLTPKGRGRPWNFDFDYDRLLAQLEEYEEHDGFLRMWPDEYPWPTSGEAREAFEIVKAWFENKRAELRKEKERKEEAPRRHESPHRRRVRMAVEIAGILLGCGYDEPVKSVETARST